MNKKGMGADFLFGMFGFFILILVVTCLLPYHVDGKLPDPNTLDYDSLELAKIFSIEQENIVVDIVYKFCDFMIYSSFKIAQAAVNFGVERPDIINPLFLFYLIIVSLCAPLLLVLFKFLIIIFLLTKEYLHVRKDNKKLKDYKKLREKRLLLKKELKGGQSK